MEILPALPQELILDKLTPQQIIQLCQVSFVYNDICLTYWPRRAARRLGIPVELWGNPTNSLEHYLTLYQQCLPYALDKPLTRACGRAVGRRAMPTEIDRYLAQGGNPEDVAYGAASALVPQLVLELIRLYPAFTPSILTQALRGAGSVGDAGQSYHRYVSDVATIYQNVIIGAASTGSLELVQAVANQLGLTPQQARGILVNWGYIALARQLGQPILPFVMAYVIGDREFITKEYQNIQTSELLYLMLDALSRLASVDTIKWFLQMVQANPSSSGITARNITTQMLYLLAFQHRDEDFLEMVRWLQQTPPPISPVPSLDDLKGILRQGSDFRIMQWAVGSRLLPDPRG